MGIFCSYQNDLWQITLTYCILCIQTHKISVHQMIIQLAASLTHKHGHYSCPNRQLVLIERVDKWFPDTSSAA